MDRRFLIIIAMLAVLVYAESADKQGRCVNIDMHKTDQSAYMGYAKKLSQRNFHYLGDRNRMPLYPAFMTLFYDETMSDEAFFNTGKRVGIAIGLAVVLSAFLLFAHHGETIDAGVAALVIMFTVVAFKAPAFQADVLYYGLFLIVFILMLKLLRKPHIGLSTLAGVSSALAHLTKASVLPAVLLFVICMAGQTAMTAVRPFRNQHESSTSAKPDWPMARKYFLSGLVFAVVFLVVISPYIRNSKAHFGHYFYNVNSTFYIWYDSWDEVKEGTRAHGDRVGWPDMAPEQTPSLRKYLREHTASQMAKRIWHGMRVIRATASNSYGYMPFIGLYFGFVALLLIQNWKQLSSPLRQYGGGVTAFFIAAFFMGYLLLYAWYVPIASGNRFFLALIMPALYLVVWIFNRARTERATIRLLGRSIPASILSTLVFALLLFYLAFSFPHLIQTIPGYT